MPTPAELWQQRQRQVTDATAAAVVRSWARVRMTDPQRTFQMVLPELLATVTAGQLAAASGADLYVSAVVRADGLSPEPVATVAPRRFAGLTSDGRTTVGLLTQPLLRTLYLRTRGADDATALVGGRESLRTLVRTEIFDTGRDAVSVAAGLEPRIVGYERQVNLPSCDRCIQLAGRVYRKSTGFSRHPSCDCSQRPVTSQGKTGAGPRALFDGMNRDQQNGAFGQVTAEIIRRGGDIGQVVNARRGMASAGSNWTTEGSRAAPRPSPGFLLKQAGDDPEKFALALDRAGYL